MTELLTRASAAASTGDDARTTSYLSSMWVRGALAALWAASLGLATLIVVVLIAWAADSRSGASATEAIRTSLQLWLLAHRVPLQLGSGTLAIAPLGLTVALVFLVARAAAVLARGHDVTSGAGVLRVTAAVGLPYTVATTLVAAAATTPSVHPSPVWALAAGFVIGTVGAAWGAARGTGQLATCWRSVPRTLRDPITAGAAGVGVLLAGASLLLLVGLLTHAGQVGDLAGVLGGGVIGDVAVALLCLALAPNAIVYALGYTTGPGFALGAGTSVTVGGAHLGALPSLPLVAAVPRGSAGAGLEVAAVVILVAAGVLTAWLIARLGHPLGQSMLTAAAAGAAAGALAAVAAALAGGPAGPGRMTAVGTSPWQLGLVVAAEITVVAAGAVGVLTWRRGR